MAAQSPRPTDSDSAGCSRRGFFRRVGAAGVGVGAIAGGSQVAPRYSPVGRAAAVEPVTTATIGIAVGAAGIAYFYGKNNAETGDDRDYSGYIGEDALLKEINIGALEMKSADERVMTSIENNVTHSSNVALTKGKAAVLEEMNAGSSESEATTAMENAIDDYYATIQENIITHWNSQLQQAAHHIERVETHENLDLLDHFEITWADNYIGLGGGDEIETASETFELLNGDTVEHDVLREVPDADSPEFHLRMIGPEGSVPYGDSYRLTFTHPDEGDVEYVEADRMASALNECIADRDTVYSDLSGFVSDVYANYAPGDIPTEDLVDPITAATELRQDYDNYAGQSAHAAILGIPTTAEHTVSLEIPDDSAEDGVWEVTGDIFTDYVPTDSDGNEVGFEVGETYDSSTWDKPLYVAYNALDPRTGETKGEFTQLEQEFTIVEAVDANGETVDSFETTSRNNQTSDVSDIEDELARLRAQINEMQKEAQEEDDDGSSIWEDIFGGDGDDSGGPLVGALLVVAAAVGIGKVVSN